MNKKTLAKIMVSVAMAAPLFAFAADGTTFASLTAAAKGVLCGVIPLLFVLATVVFLYGVVKYVIAGGDEKKMDSGKQFMIYGLIGLFVMVAVWGIVNAAVSTFFNGSGGGGSGC